jgi:hypothetical protein
MCVTEIGGRTQGRTDKNTYESCEGTSDNIIHIPFQNV